MASLYLSWNNSTVLANPNAIAQRAYWRLKTTGGAFNVTNFTPSNDLATSINSLEFTAATPNKVYEFKIAALCSVGGPTENNNGVIESISFGCVLPELSIGTSNINVIIDIPNTDITKARLRLKKQSDNSVVSTATVNKVANAITHNFIGLTENTGYYLEVEFYAIVNGVEVISSSVDYLGAVCGGNTTGYQATTLISCYTYTVTPDNDPILGADFQWIDCATNELTSVNTTTPYIVCAVAGSVALTGMGGASIVQGALCES